MRSILRQGTLIMVLLIIPARVAWSQQESPAASAADDSASSPVTPVRELNVEQKQLLRTLQTMVNRSRQITKTAERQNKLQQAREAIGLQLANRTDQPALEVELMLLRVQISLDEGFPEHAATAADELLNRYVTLFGEEGLELWLPERVDRLVNLREFDSAVALLRAAKDRQPEMMISAQRAMRMGDILVQKAYPNGPYDSAIRVYMQAADQYRQVFPDLAEEIRLRQAKTLWLNGQIDVAKTLFNELGQSSNEAVGEEARHIPALLEQMDAAKKQGHDVTPTTQPVDMKEQP
ncbi:MAG: hypothetical protein HJJLKODD_00785 [Phycisphaerae bacterium]|nr:hypothetical protein [Phycisphaerae bacterium]